MATLSTVWPFAVAVLGVLGVHELGHYVASRYHRVEVSLPYFIPVPSVVGTMGAVIVMRGRIPDRRALFDIGAAGPLAGLVAAAVVAGIGLVSPPITVPDWALDSGAVRPFAYGSPLLLKAIAGLLGQPLGYADPAKAVNPVVFGGWVGMFVTFLNLLPVGQLDGGHIRRAVVGEPGTVGRLVVPGVLFGLAAFLLATRQAPSSAAIWAFWGVLSLGLTYGGTAEPVLDEPLGPSRVPVAIATLVLGLLCFTPVPVQAV